MSIQDAINILTREGYTITPPNVTITDELFERFWNLYDKKVGRDKAIKLWRKLCERDKQECLNYIPYYKRAQPDKQYRKNPETFLRNKSWRDELIYRQSPDQSADKASAILRG